MPKATNMPDHSENEALALALPVAWRTPRRIALALHWSQDNIRRYGVQQPLSLQCLDLNHMDAWLFTRRPSNGMVHDEGRGTPSV